MQTRGPMMRHWRLVNQMARITETDLVTAFEEGRLSSDAWAGMVNACGAEPLLERYFPEEKERACLCLYHTSLLTHYASTKPVRAKAECRVLLSRSVFHLRRSLVETVVHTPSTPAAATKADSSRGSPACHRQPTGSSERARPDASDMRRT